MRVQLLGPVEGFEGGARLDLGGPKQRTVLATLCVNPGETVSRDRLAGAVWGEEIPPRANRILSSYVSTLRASVGNVLVSRSIGYAAEIRRDHVDAALFEDRVAKAREGSARPSETAGLLREALSLWKGEPFQGLDGYWVLGPHVTRLTELRISALESALEAELQIGSTDAVAELSNLVEEHPRRDKLRALLMHALYLNDRQTEALSMYRAYRDELIESTGLDPAPALQEMETRILQQDPGLYLGASENSTSSVHLVSSASSDREKSTKGRHNLPIELTSFVGRRAEVDQLQELVSGSPLVTMVGHGGAGKTRLAKRVAVEALPDFDDGVWLVELASVADPQLVPVTVATSLGLSTPNEMPIADAIVRYLKSRELLLILDNCEHVAAQVGALASRVLGESPNVRILATSRRRLAVPGEQVYLVDPLPFGSPVDTELPDAQQLFQERAQSVNPVFRVDQRNRDFVDEIVRITGGIPLAIELAAARVEGIPIRDLSEHLAEHHDLLVSSDETTPERQRSIAGSLEWSYQLLTDDERLLLARLSAFSDGFTIPAVEEVCEGGTLKRSRLLHLLASLVGHSLVVAANEEGRYWLLEPVRQFSEAKLIEAGAEVRLYVRHAEHFAILAEDAAAGLRGTDQLRWLKRLRTERGNLRRALARAMAMEQYELAAQIAVSLAWPWWAERDHQEAVRWLESVVQAGSSLPPQLLARATMDLGSHVLELPGGLQRGRRHLDEALRLFRKLDDRTGEVACLKELGTLVLHGPSMAKEGEEFLNQFFDMVETGSHEYALGVLLLGRWERTQGRDQDARRHFEEARRLLTSVGDQFSVASATIALAGILSRQEDYERAELLTTSALPTVRDIGDPAFTSGAIGLLGHINTLRGDHEAAIAAHEQEVEIDTNAWWGPGGALISLGVAHRYAGDTALARSLILQGLKRTRDDWPSEHWQMTVSEGLQELAGLETEENPVHAAKLLGAGRAMWDYDYQSEAPYRKRRFENDRDRLIRQLGESEFQVLFEEGSGRSRDEAMLLALDE